MSPAPYGQLAHSPRTWDFLQASQTRQATQQHCSTAYRRQLSHGTESSRTLLTRMTPPATVNTPCLRQTTHLVREWYYHLNFVLNTYHSLLQTNIRFSPTSPSLRRKVLSPESPVLSPAASQYSPISF